METTYLQEYVSVADCGSFTAAARELHLTQSTLSKHIAVLEREFDADLFVRDRNGVTLTEAGRVLYAQAKRIQHLVGQTRALMGEVSAGCPAPEGTGARGRLAGVGAGVPDGAEPGESSAFAGAREGTPADAALRCKCRCLARQYGLDGREAGALALYLEERSFQSIERDLGLSRDQLADVLGSAYRKLGVRGKQEALDFVHSVSE